MDKKLLQLWLIELCWMQKCYTDIRLTENNHLYCGRFSQFNISGLAQVSQWKM